ncbi:MAG TPA: Gldg family protein [Steroidobacteraceae bacterium]|nr:Gldg family protein [Steroidobacteraceae bacterium]
MAFDLHKVWQGHGRSGAIALLLLAVLFIGLVIVINYGLRGARVDLTQNRLYTLAPGTRNILKNLDEPINLYFYFTRGAADQVPYIKTYANRVRDMLEELAARSNGKIRLQVIDPEPFSEAQDRADELGVSAVPLGATGETLYFGLAGTNSTDGRAVIDFFQPEKEEFLEYDLAKLIVDLSRPKKAVIGLLSTLPMGTDFNQATGQMREPWVVMQQLEQLFTVKTLTPALSSIDPDVDALMLVHPKGLSQSALYAIDQFVLRGGRMLVFVDPQAEADPAGAQQPGNPFGNMGADKSSNLAPLFAAWGIEFNPRQVVGDMQYALSVGTRTGESTRHIAFIGFDKEALNAKDVITTGLKNINAATVGSLKLKNGSSLTFEPLLQSSAQAGLLPVERFAFLSDPATLRDGFRPTGERYVIAARLSGKLKTAFPNGNPAANTTPAPPSPIPAALKESAQPANIVVVADTDLLTDNLWVRSQSFFGQRFATAWANNGDLVFNAIDNLTGNGDLISIRGRASFVRPFERVEALRRDAEDRFRAKEQELQQQLRETEQKLTELQSRRSDKSSLILTPEQEKELTRFQDEKVRIRKDLREVRHGLDQDIERLGTVLKLVDILLVPVLILIAALLAYVWRRQRRAPTA